VRAAFVQVAGPLAVEVLDQRAPELHLQDITRRAAVSALAAADERIRVDTMHDDVFCDVFSREFTCGIAFGLT
jgi:hypothetical protein